MSNNDQGTAATVAGTAKDEAAGLAHTAADSGKDLLHEVQHEAAGVAGTAAEQARDLLGEARAGLTSQASDQQVRAAASLRALGDEFARMADGSQDGGLATDVVRQVAQRTSGVATWLEDREPGDVLGEVTDFARRRPGTFLAIAAGAGILAGRLTRGIKDAPPAPERQHRAPEGSSTSTPAHATAPVPDAGAAPSPVTSAGAHVASPPAGASTVGGPAPVAPASGHGPASDDHGTAGGDPLAGLVREDRP